MSGAAERFRALSGGDLARSVLPGVIALAEGEGILPRIRREAPLTLDALCDRLERELGYDLRTGKRRRMIAVLLDLLAEAGVLSRNGGLWTPSEIAEGGEPAPPAADIPSPEDASAGEGEIDFFRRCLEKVPAYLRGGGAAFSFTPAHEGLWDRFLGCDTFRNGRDLLLELLVVREKRAFRLFDLCHGPGWGVSAAVRAFPGIRITALDFTDSFARLSRERVEAQRAVNAARGLPDTEVVWLGPERWRGFGDPLPFEAGAFDAVLFSGGDPYIPRPLRAGVYREVHRILVPGGRLGVLTRGYPDRERVHVPSAGMRIASLIHDFAESVCDGWEGFADVGESLEMFRGIGFGEAPLLNRVNAFESSIWVLRKGAADD